MCDKDEWEWVTRRMWRMHCINIPIVPNIETLFKLCPSIDERISIGHHVVLFMAINIYPIHLFTIFPVQPCKPTLCCRQWDPWFVDTKPCEDALNCVAHNYVANILCLEKPWFSFFSESFLDFPCNIFILKNCWPLVAIGMEGEVPLIHKLDNPSPNVVCPVWASTLCLCNNDWGLPPGMWDICI